MDSKKYWENRYKNGGNSGAGSCGHLAVWKAEVINNFLIKQQIKTVIEFGCGDGEQLSLYDMPMYIGIDVSQKAVDLCNSKFNSAGMLFACLLGGGSIAHLTLSVDVIYHLLEDDVYEKYMNELFDTSEKYVIIYSTDNEDLHNIAEHIKHRNLTKWVSENKKDFKLISNIKNKYPYTGDTLISSSCDFYIYKKG